MSTRLKNGAYKIILLGLAALIAACSGDASAARSGLMLIDQPTPQATLPAPGGRPDVALPTPPFPARPLYAAGQLVDYTAQDGDTIPLLAWRFNTTPDAILEANPFIPPSTVIMPPGMPMKIPIYYQPFWGSPYQILPDSLFVNGPAQSRFDTRAFLKSRSTWLNDYTTFASDTNMDAATVIDYLARHYSISPRLLLALLEYRTGALSKPTTDLEEQDFALGLRNWDQKGLFNQLAWAADRLNDFYYRYRAMHVAPIEHKDGRIERIDPWQNAASVSLILFFNDILDTPDYYRAIGPDGFARTYRQVFGDPWQNLQPHLPGSLAQPELTLPFEPGKVWAYTGGPHTGWGTLEPYAAIDFAPPSGASGCQTNDNWVTAMTEGLALPSEVGEVILDLDKDGDIRTGWVIYQLHVASDGRIPPGTVVKRGDRVGHPSCEGGHATGTHVHIARLYNGEWMQADGMLPFVMEGWSVRAGTEPYLGQLTRNAQVVTACVCSNHKSFIQTERK
jgi:murein DD-endopeptidase MepM/ murein hydrolase activator NlpD